MAGLPSRRCRLIDTGLREGRANIAYDAALIELHAQGKIGDTLRFLRFRPTALVGRHQAIGRELKLDECEKRGVDVARRITGGGAIYFDEGMFGWELVVSRARLGSPALGELTGLICESVAEGLSGAFGIEARFRPRNDIEVGGRKISGTGGFFDGDTVFFQGTLLIDTDPVRVMSVLNVPRAKLQRHGADAAEARITTLAALLGAAPQLEQAKMAVMSGLARGLGLEFAAEEPSEEEECHARALHDAEIGTDAFVYEIDAPDAADILTHTHASPGGTISAAIRCDGPASARRIGHVLFTGDFFVTPPRLVMDLEAALRGVPVEDAGATVARFFASTPAGMMSVAADDFRAVLCGAIAMGSET